MTENDDDEKPKCVNCGKVMSWGMEYYDENDDPICSDCK